MQTRALAIHDISCVGRCSLTVALPILSAAGVNTSILPTALLSTHTGEFTGYTHLDLSDQLLPIARHIATLGLPWDALYSGYLASPEQARMVEEILSLLSSEQTHVFVDPAFADHGRLYSLLDESMPQAMRRLCAHARTITPNLTEACLMLGTPCQPATPTSVAALLRRLADMGPRNVVVTDVSYDAQHTGVAVYQADADEERYYQKPRRPGVFHGTGDVLASFLLGALLCGKPLFEAVRLALDSTQESIAYTLEDGQPLRYGVQFERALPEYIASLRAQ